MLWSSRACRTTSVSPPTTQTTGTGQTTGQTTGHPADPATAFRPIRAGVPPPGTDHRADQGTAFPPTRDLARDRMRDPPRDPQAEIAATSCKIEAGARTVTITINLLGIQSHCVNRWCRVNRDMFRKILCTWEITDRLCKLLLSSIVLTRDTYIDS